MFDGSWKVQGEKCFSTAQTASDCLAVAFYARLLNVETFPGLKLVLRLLKPASNRFQTGVALDLTRLSPAQRQPFACILHSYHPNFLNLRKFLPVPIGVLPHLTYLTYLTYLTLAASLRLCVTALKFLLCV